MHTPTTPRLGFLIATDAAPRRNSPHCPGLPAILAPDCCVCLEFLINVFVLSSLAMLLRQPHPGSAYESIRHPCMESFQRAVCPLKQRHLLGKHCKQRLVKYISKSSSRE